MVMSPANRKLLHVGTTCGNVKFLNAFVPPESISHKSSKIWKLLQKTPQPDLSILLQDIPADHETMEIVARFCHGFDISISTQNVVRVACVAHYLGMTDTHCPDNLFAKAISFFQQNILTSWANSITALKSAEPVLQPALQLGLVNYCVESLISKALENPRLLGEPVNDSPLTSEDEDDDGREIRRCTRRKLFSTEDLTSLSLRLYAPTLHAMTQKKVPHEYVAASICQYAKTWLFDDEANARKEIIETLVSLLPDNHTYLVPCDFLSEMLKFAIALDASDECKNYLEMRMGKQLEHASVNDLLIPSLGYARDEKYDMDCVRRILKNFYFSYTGGDPSPLASVSELVEEFLAEVAGDIDLRTGTFMEIADMAVAVASGAHRGSDGIYRAVDVYLEKHRHLTESEREKVCRVVEWGRLSGEACEHAARNERLPVRVVVQVLFAVQLRLREAIPREVEMERMGSKVSELERECRVMKTEIESGVGGGKSGKRKRMSLWRDMKRKLGCVTNTINDCNCHVKRKKGCFCRRDGGGGGGAVGHQISRRQTTTRNGSSATATQRVASSREPEMPLAYSA
ncbi:BTB/POZ domain-containing protein [Striga hermonthica]|uniref:BTB/POZ domain-containing protein n=1 Tax=Striga hermonthica TaxID=68872 RepID=A0A9N7MKX0_STRHE|nr:BTB/POZ domain-containing protein [Striga hermonthica]